ncbi:MAG: DMT family transporter [Anaerolineae bacterium]
MSRRASLYLMAFATVVLWGASFPLTKAALEWVGPTAIAFLRWSISAVALFAWLARCGRLGEAWALLRSQTFRVWWVALTGIALFYFLENSALRFTTATNAGVLSNLTSVFIALLAALWLRERPRAIEWGAMATAFAGAALVSQGAGHLALGSTGWLGDGMMIVATLFAALYSIGGKKLVEAYAAEVVLADVALVGAALLLPLTIWEANGPTGLAAFLHLPASAWLALLLLGLGAGALANIWWLRILGATTAARAGMVLFLIPIVSTLIAVFALGESLTLLMVIGGGLVLLGVALVERDRANSRGNHDQDHGSH